MGRAYLILFRKYSVDFLRVSLISFEEGVVLDFLQHPPLLPAIGIK